MFSSKKNILETVALLKAYNIEHVVLSPGSRNAPLIHTITQDPFFRTQIIVDERNAAFYAIGIIQKTQKPVVICCTSGTALLNYAPAVAEAYYANLPLIVISADRASEWIGQMDGQTIPQQEALTSIVKKKVHIPEINTETEHWFANRLLNEALISATAGQPGPVHINIPISEPLFDFLVEELPQVRKINFEQGKVVLNDPKFTEIFKNSNKVLIIVGQMFPCPELNEILEALALETKCVILKEHLSNLDSPAFIANFDTILATQNRDELIPDLVITLGGHIVSKRLKHFLRKYKPQYHWHLSANAEVVDLYQSLTHLIEADSLSFLRLLKSVENTKKRATYSQAWATLSEKVKEPTEDLPFSDITVTGSFLKGLPENSALHLANSSAVRNAQLFSIDPSIRIFCNRGTNGIESSLPSAIGFASVSSELTFLLIGDLSFFYTVGSLWNLGNIKNLRILLINNRGGAIFHLLPGMNKSEALPKYIGAGHDADARIWAEAGGLSYLSATNEAELHSVLPKFFSSKEEKAIILEVFTEIDKDKEASEIYFARPKA